MPFYSGKGSGVVFTSTTRAGTKIYLTANQWTVDIKDEAINITNIKPMRDNKILEEDLKAVPGWDQCGIPMEKLNGGMRETVVTVHGFLFYDRNVNVKLGPAYPVINEKGKLELEYSDDNGRKRVLFTMDEAVVTSTKVDASIGKCIEYDIEFNALNYGVDPMFHPKAK